MKRFLIGVVVLALCGCGPTNKPVTFSTASDQPSITSTSTPPEVATIGRQTVKYDNGLEVTVVRLRKVKISQYASGGTPAQQGVLVTVLIKNGTTEVFDTALTTVDVKYGTEGEQAGRVFDGESALGFQGTIQVGRKATAVYEFAIAKSPKRTVLAVTVKANWNDEPAQYTGTI